MVESYIDIFVPTISKQERIVAYVAATANSMDIRNCIARRDGSESSAFIKPLDVSSNDETAHRKKQDIKTVRK
jgi:hypothetical protein